MAKPNAFILYSTLANGPKLFTRRSTQFFIVCFSIELNRFGITSAVDAGGGFQNYPDDYEVVNELHPDEPALRSSSRQSCIPKKAGQEIADFVDGQEQRNPGRAMSLYPHQWCWRDACGFSSPILRTCYNRDQTCRP